MLGELNEGPTAGLLGRVGEWVVGSDFLMDVMKKVVVEVRVGGLAVVIGEEATD